jgi:hypothetical protein
VCRLDGDGGRAGAGHQEQDQRGGDEPHFVHQGEPSRRNGSLPEHGSDTPSRSGRVLIARERPPHRADLEPIASQTGLQPWASAFVSLHAVGPKLGTRAHEGLDAGFLTVGSPKGRVRSRESEGSHPGHPESGSTAPPARRPGPKVRSPVIPACSPPITGLAIERTRRFSWHFMTLLLRVRAFADRPARLRGPALRAINDLRRTFKGAGSKP